jgi:hypothetical protein
METFMKKGICARHYTSVNSDTFLGAGFEEISATYPNSMGASELCADTENFEAALDMAIAEKIPTLVIPSTTPIATF